MASPRWHSPAISTGIYGYPIELAAEIALTTVRKAVTEVGAVQEVVFCCFSTGDLAIYERQLKAASLT